MHYSELYVLQQLAMKLPPWPCAGSAVYSSKSTGRDRFNNGKCEINIWSLAEEKESDEQTFKITSKQREKKKCCFESATGDEIDSYKLKRVYTGRNSRAENWEDFCINLQLITG